MPRPILATIHQAALRANLARLARAAPDARVWAIVKANAYGHGIERVFDALRGADGFALLDLAEAERVRALGWRGPILLLEGAFEPRDLEHCSRLGLWHVVHHAQQIDWLAAHKAQTPQRVFLKLNSGMNRLGFAPEAFRGAWARLSALPQVEDVALMTHFSDADGPRLGRDGVAHQVDCFARVTQDLPGERSLCNSAAALLHARAGLSADWIRPGIAVYGSAPDFPTHSAAQLELQPTMSLRTRLIATQTLRAGDTVGYGSAFQAERDMRIGIAACGYADGYPRHAPGGAQLSTPALLEGVRTRLVGRVSMDMLAVDLEPAQQQGLRPDVGSEVVLWGRSALGPVLPVDEVAHAAGTVAYELLCALAPRVPVQVDDADN